MTPNYGQMFLGLSMMFFGFCNLYQIWRKYNPDKRLGLPKLRHDVKGKEEPFEYVYWD